MSSATRRQLEEWLKTIDVKADCVLDIGGSQNPICGRTKSWHVKDYRILDLESPHECKMKPDYIGDIQNSNTLMEIIYDEKKFDFEKFDTVFCIEVSEYWYTPFTAICNIFDLMKKGDLFISTHFIYPVHNPSNDDCIRYTPKGIEKMLRMAGFDIVSNTPRVTETGIMNEVYQSEGMRQSKDSDSEIIGSLIYARKD